MPRDLHISHKYVIRFLNLLDGSQRFSNIEQRRPEGVNFNLSDRRVLLLESAVEVLSTSLQYEVVVRAERVCLCILLAVFIPSKALDDAVLVTNEVMYSPLPIETLVVFELLDDQVVTLCTCTLVSL